MTLPHIILCNYSDGLAPVVDAVLASERYKVTAIVTAGTRFALAPYRRFDYHKFAIGKINHVPSGVLDEEILQAFSRCESIALKMMDRYENIDALVSYRARIDLYHKLLSYWIDYLTENDVEAVSFTQTPHVVFDYILYEVAQHLKIPTLMFHRIPVLKHANVSMYKFANVADHSPQGLAAPEYKRQSSFTELQLSLRMRSYLDLSSDGSDLTFKGVEKRPLREKTLKRVFGAFSYRIRNFVRWYALGGRIKWLIFSLLVNAKKKKIILSDLPAVFPPKCILLSLHYQPECSTSPMAGCYVHQDLILGLLQRHLPKDYFIFVKPHVRDGLDQRTFGRIQLDERTQIISPRERVEPYLDKFTAVATCTGTLGWQAVINLVPVLMFGEYFYKHAPGVFRIKTANDLIKAVEGLGESRPTRQSLINFLAILDRGTFEGWVDNRYSEYTSQSDEENVAVIRDSIFEFLQQESSRNEDF